MTDDERLIGAMSEAIDRAALDPRQWPCLLDTIRGALPGTKATIHVADTRDRSSIGVIHRGFETNQIAEYEQHYAKINPWVPFLMRAPTLQALIADEQMPASSFRETEFYRDWLAPVGDMDSTVGIKLAHEPDRMAVIAIHYAPLMAERYNRQLARVLQASAIRLRRAVDASRPARGREGAGPAPVVLGAFTLPALLLDGRGRVLQLNDPAKSLIAERALHLGANNALRLGDAPMSECVAAVARQIAAGQGQWSQGLDVSVTIADGRRLTLSLVAVREPVMAGGPAFFAPSRLTLLLVRPRSRTEATGQSSLERQFGLTPAERRLAMQVGSGLSLRQSADQLGIAYHTARSQLKAVFGKTGVSRQAELVALLARPSVGGRPSRSS
jgi:DNA-binding CsgD family transcriptional regulator